jgi:hypothetical protein
MIREIVILVIMIDIQVVIMMTIDGIKRVEEVTETQTWADIQVPVMILAVIVVVVAVM